MQIESLKDLSHYYNSTDSRYIYFDKTFDIRGTDYTKFIKLQYESINNSHIKDKYTIDGWYILWYLMSRAIKNEYVSLTVNSISEETNLKPMRIKDALGKLILHEVIIIDKDIITLTNNELIKVYIGYNNKLCNHITQNGYTPIPSEFVYKVITTLSPTEWSIYTVLLTKYNYYLAWEKINYSTGELMPIYHRTHYAFPSRTQIGEIIGVIDDTISKFLKKLEQSKYNLLNKYKSDAYSFWDEEEQIQKIRGGNNRYEIKLFERPEYVYYYLNTQLDKTMQKEFDYIKKKGFEEIAQSNEQELIRNKKIYYLKYYYGNILEQYNKCVNEEDYELYKYIRDNYKIII
ncbi:MAG: hypothetical protein A2Y34_05470 [Spirochaetes bacterium GWC1_27_15]|nr:MAG: hypothetical protein A2Y34_05470 [Spirochaetes bacterium GWC1_27_15]